MIIPVKGVISDFGGGSMTVVVDQDTLEYIGRGTPVMVIQIGPDETGEYDPDAGHPFEDMTRWKGSGVLWAINRYLFHPRGFALNVHMDDEGHASGWSIQGDGTECWSFTVESDEAGFAAFEAALDALRPAGGERP